MTDCFKYEMLINCMLDGEITPEEQIELENHLEECENCRRYLEEMRKIREKLGDMELEAPQTLVLGVMKKIKSEQKTKRIIRLRYYAAAAAAVVVIISAVTLLPRLKSGKADSARYSMAVDKTEAEGGAFPAAAGGMMTSSANGVVENTEIMMMDAPEMPEAACVETTDATANAESGKEAREGLNSYFAGAPQMGLCTVPGAANNDSVSGLSAEIPEIDGRNFRLYVFIPEGDDAEIPENAEKIESDDGRTCYILGIDDGKMFGENEIYAETLYNAEGEEMAVIVIG